MDTFITELFETPRHTPAASVYRAYEQECRKRHLTALSARAFYQRIKQRSGPHQTEQREGTRAAYQETPWFWELEYQTPRHGSRPFEIAHIDHTELDIEVRSSSTGELLGKPWVTFMVDAYARRLLAVYLTFDPPSYRSVMMVLRICVQRFERFPQSIVVDGGKEFQSVYFESLLAQYRCTKKTRPWAKPHFGSVIERLFETTELRRQAKRDGVHADLSSARLAAHMSKAGAHEELLRQRLRDLDQKKVLAIIASQPGHPQTLGRVVPTPAGQPEAVTQVEKLAALSTPVDVSRLPRLGDYD